MLFKFLLFSIKLVKFKKFNLMKKVELHLFGVDGRRKMCPRGEDGKREEKHIYSWQRRVKWSVSENVRRLRACRCELWTEADACSAAERWGNWWHAVLSTADCMAWLFTRARIYSTARVGVPMPLDRTQIYARIDCAIAGVSRRGILFHPRQILGTWFFFTGENKTTQTNSKLLNKQSNLNTPKWF
jgi:hypothetical protein